MSTFGALPGPVLVLAPGARLADVASVKFHERVQLMRMDCIA